jgi:hypothetical protein
VGGLYAGKLLQYDPIDNVYTDFADIRIRDVNDSPLLAKRYLGRLAGLNSAEDVVYLVQLIGEVASGSGVSGSGESGSGSGIESGSVAGSESGSIVASGPCTGTCYWMWVGTGWALTSSDCSDGCGPCVSPGSAGTYFGQLETTSCVGESGSVPDSGFSGSTAESGSVSGISGSVISGSGISGSVSGSGISGSVASGSGSGISGSVSGSELSGSIASGSGSGISGSVSGSGISGSVSGSVAGSVSGSVAGSGSGTQSGGLTIEVVTDVQCVNGSIVVTKQTIFIPGGS